MPRELHPLLQSAINQHITNRPAILTWTMPYMDQLGISSNIEFPTERADYRTDSDFHELLPLLYVSFHMATSTDRSISGYPPGPFPQRQHFPRSGAVAASPYACHPSCRPLRGRCTSIADGITIRPIVPIKRAITGCSCHNGSNSRDSMPLRYRAKRKRLQKRLPQDATKNAKFLHRSRLLRNLDSVHIYWGASAMQIEQVHLHCSRLLRIFTA